MFLALLELIKTRQVFARQKEVFGDIRIYPVRYEEEEKPGSAIIETNDDKGVSAS